MTDNEKSDLLVERASLARRINGDYAAVLIRGWRRRLLQISNVLAEANMEYNFELIRAKLIGTNASAATLRNRKFATDEQMYTALLHCKQHDPIRLGNGTATRAAHNAGLLEYAPLTERQEITIKRNPDAKLSRKMQLSTGGKRYLDDLHAELYTPKTKADRAFLRTYERRFNPSLRWTAAVVRAQRIAALNILDTEHDAHVADTRALMAGAI